MAIIFDSKQIKQPIQLSGSFTGSFIGNVIGTASYVDTNQIITGSIIARVDINPNNIFLIKSGSSTYFNIASNSETSLYSDLFIIKNFTTQQTILTINQNIVQFATHSVDPTGVTKAGSIWFTPTTFYVGLE